MKLNLGCAQDIRDGYINIDVNPIDDRVTRGDVRDLPFIETNSVDEIIARDVIEHMPLVEAKNAILEWKRILKCGGKIYLQSIDIIAQIKALTTGVWKIEDFNHMLFAGVNYIDGKSIEADWHKCALSLEYITEYLNNNGFEILESARDEIEPIHYMGKGGWNLNFRIWARKL
jgi:SAM-dependent methyltransferase